MSRKSRSYEARERRKCRAKEDYDTAVILADKTLKPYKCPWCPKWHQTEIKPERDRRGSMNRMRK